MALSHSTRPNEVIDKTGTEEGYIKQNKFQGRSARKGHGSSGVGSEK
jgi:hypothetical protein